VRIEPRSEALLGSDNLNVHSRVEQRANNPAQKREKQTGKGIAVDG